jgi:hypothetical protein
MFCAAFVVARRMPFEEADETGRVEIGPFSDSWPDKSDFETDVLETIERKGTGLVLSRATVSGWRWEGRPKALRPFSAWLYRLRSPRHHGYLDFDLLPHRAGYVVHAQMLAVEVSFQGNFYSLRDFLDQILETLFALRRNPVYCVTGRLLKNDMPIRAKRGSGDWREQRTPDGETKLGKLYARLGAVRYPSPPGTVTIYSPTALELLKFENPAEAARVESEISGNRRVPVRAQSQNQQGRL